MYFYDLWRLRWKRRLRRWGPQAFWGVVAAMWIFAMWIAAKHNFGKLAFILSSFLAIFVCLATSKEREASSLSAWSVFNPNFQAIPGTMDAKALDQQLRGLPAGGSCEADKDENPSRWEKQTEERNSKVGRNELCQCGSGRKFKVCCMRGTS
eukprot:GGOE01060756.1.p2 GENE.GGOE01060756.1~~GGOE01060756.1.p2  ORF type:complete len:152 (+),score=5.44 GGOE01060756.1:54-509(+)